LIVRNPRAIIGKNQIDERRLNDNVDREGDVRSTKPQAIAEKRVKDSIHRKLIKLHQAI